MLFELLSASLCNLSTHALEFASHQTYPQKPTNRRRLVTILQELELMLDAVDQAYVRLETHDDYHAPCMFEKPSLRSMKDALRRDEDVLVTAIELVENVRKYVILQQFAVERMRDVAEALCSQTFCALHRRALRHIVNTVPKDMRRETLRQISNVSDIVLDTIYKDCEFYGDTFYSKVGAWIDDVKKVQGGEYKCGPT